MGEGEIYAGVGESRTEGTAWAERRGIKEVKGEKIGDEKRWTTEIQLVFKTSLSRRTFADPTSPLDPWFRAQQSKNFDGRTQNELNRRFW